MNSVDLPYNFKFAIFLETLFSICPETYFSVPIQARKDNRRLIRVSMLISVRGIKMSDLETGKTLLNFSIYR